MPNNIGSKNELLEFIAKQNPLISEFVHNVDDRMQAGSSGVWFAKGNAVMGKIACVLSGLAALGLKIAVIQKPSRANSVYEFMTSTFCNGYLADQMIMAVGMNGNEDYMSDSKIKIIHMTDVFLAARSKFLEETLAGIDAVVFDEIHERSVDMERIVQLIPELNISNRPVNGRAPCQIIIMSTILDTITLNAHFGGKGEMVELGSGNSNASDIEEVLIEDGAVRNRFDADSMMKCVEISIRDHPVPAILLWITRWADAHKFTHAMKHFYPQYAGCVHLFHGEATAIEQDAIAQMPAPKIVIAKKFEAPITLIRHIVDIIVCSTPEQMLFETGEQILTHVLKSWFCGTQLEDRDRRIAPLRIFYISTKSRFLFHSKYAENLLVPNDLWRYILNMAEDFPGRLPTEAGMFPKTLSMKTLPVVINHGIKTLKFFQLLAHDPTHHPHGVQLTSAGLQAKTERLVLRAAIFWVLAKKVDCLVLKQKMVEMAVVLNLQFSGRSIVVDSMAHENFMGHFPPLKALLSLGTPDIPVLNCGDLAADIVELFWHQHRSNNMDPWYNVNPGFSTTLRHEARALAKTLRENIRCVGDKCSDNCGETQQERDIKHRREIDLRMMYAFADNLVVITEIRRKKENNEDSRPVTWVKGRITTTGTIVNITKNTAFDFAAFSTSRSREWVPAKPLYFVYTQISQSRNSEGLGYIISRLHHIPQDVVQQFDAERKPGQSGISLPTSNST